MTRQSPDFVLEFIVNYVTCRNFNAMACPLSVTIPGCPPIELNPKKTSMTKLTYEKGKRLIFQHSRLLDLKVVFELRAGHGNAAVRGKCSFDFFEISDQITENNPTIYEVDVTLLRSDQSRFGVLNCSFQIFPYREYEEIKKNPMQTSARVIPPQSQNQNSINKTTKKSIVKPVQSSRGVSQKRQTTAYRSYNSQKGKRQDEESNAQSTTKNSIQPKTYRPLNAEQAA